MSLPIGYRRHKVGNVVHLTETCLGETLCGEPLGKGNKGTRGKACPNCNSSLCSIEPTAPEGHTLIRPFTRKKAKEHVVPEGALFWSNRWLPSKYVGDTPTPLSYHAYPTI